jgi:hypothetical protein
MKNIILLCLIAILLCGCNGSREVENRDFVLGCALEKSGNKYTAYAAIAVLSADSNESGREVIVKKGYGTSAKTAFENLDSVTSGKLFFGQCSVAICDEYLSFNELADFCENNNEMSKNVILLKGENAENIFETEYGTSSAVAFIEDYYDNNQNARKVTLNDYYIVKSKNEEINIPTVTLYDDEIKISD